MSQTKDLIENEEAPHDVLSGLYGVIKAWEKGHPQDLPRWGREMDTDTLKYRVLRSGDIEIELSLDEYCGRGCHCFLGTTTETHVIPDSLLTIYETWRKLGYESHDDEDAIKASFDIAMWKYIESLRNSKERIS